MAGKSGIPACKLPTSPASPPAIVQPGRPRCRATKPKLLRRKVSRRVASPSHKTARAARDGVALQPAPACSRNQLLSLRQSLLSCALEEYPLIALHGARRFIAVRMAALPPPPSSLKPASSISAADALTPLIKSTYTTPDLAFYVNGSKVVLSNPDPHWTLLDFIRSQHGLKGTKLGCGEGGCGACTVVLQTKVVGEKRIKHVAVNACLFPLVGVDGKHVITVEGIGNVSNPHPLQERIAKLHGKPVPLRVFTTRSDIHDIKNGMFNQMNRLTMWILHSWDCHVPLCSDQEFL